MNPPRRALVKAALLTALVSLASFGAAHAAFITPLVEPNPDVHPLARWGVMFAAPVAFGVPFTLVATALSATAWNATRQRGRLRSWRFGAALASPFAVMLGAILVFGPPADETPSASFLVAAFLAAVTIPVAAGAWAGGTRGAVLMPLAALPILLPVAAFTGGTAPADPRVLAWTGLFLASVVVIWVLSGIWLERFVARFTTAATGPRAGP